MTTTSPNFVSTTEHAVAGPTGIEHSTKKHTVLRAEGFSCPSCVAKIEKQVGRLKGVANVEVHFATSRITVDHDPKTATVGDIVKAVGKAGYVARPAAF